LTTSQKRNKLQTRGLCGLQDLSAVREFWRIIIRVFASFINIVPPTPLNKSAKLHTAIIIVFLCLIFQFIGCATNKNIITETNIELISWSFNNSGISHADYSLFTLSPVAAARNPQLNNFLNTLLYRGKTAQEYLDDVKESSLEWNREWHEESFTWEIRGKYLLLKKRETGGSGSSYETVSSYIIDTALVKRLTIDDIIIDSGNSNLQELLLDRLSRADNFYFIPSASGHDIFYYFYQSLEEKYFRIFFEGSNVVFHWDKGLLASNSAGAFKVVLQRSEVLPFLTDTGREILNMQAAALMPSDQNTNLSR
jgi:hypothetical protein